DRDGRGSASARPTPGAHHTTQAQASPDALPTQGVRRLWGHVHAAFQPLVALRQVQEPTSPLPTMRPRVPLEETLALPGMPCPQGVACISPGAAQARPLPGATMQRLRRVLSTARGPLLVLPHVLGAASPTVTASAALQRAAGVRRLS